MHNEEQRFLNDPDKRLWDADDCLRSNTNPGDCYTGGEIRKNLAGRGYGV